MKMRYSTFLFLMVLIATPAIASDDVTSPMAVIDCISKIGEETHWEACRTMMFEPCEEHAVGTATHVACLLGQKRNWDEQLGAHVTELNRKLTTAGAASLSDSLSQWYEYRKNRCEAVARERAAIGFSAEAAGYGCEIAETVGIVSDLDTCLKGESTAPYCTIREE